MFRPRMEMQGRGEANLWLGMDDTRSKFFLMTPPAMRLSTTDGPTIVDPHVACIPCDRLLSHMLVIACEVTMVVGS